MQEDYSYTQFDLVEGRGERRSDFLLLEAVGFLIGVAVGSRFIADSMFFVVGVLFGILAVVVLWWMGKRSWFKWFVLAVMFGVLRIGLEVFWVGNLSAFNDLPEKLVMEGVISTVPLVVENNQQLMVSIESVQDSHGKHLVDGLLKIKLERYPAYYLGQRIRLTGNLKTPVNAADFNYVDYLAKDKIFSVVNGAKIKIIDEKIVWWNWPLSGVNWVHDRIVERLSALFSEPVAGIVAGIQVGQRSTISKDILQNFQTVGLTHILAISGFNITLIINVVAAVLVNMSRKKRFWLVSGLILFFVFLTGCSASVVRAAVMGELLLILKLLGRKSEVLVVILLSAVLMVWFAPRILNFDISFQLSFFATLSLVLFSEPLEKWAENWPELGKDGVLVTLSAQVMTLPISFYNFGNISLIAPLSNMLILPLVPAIMACSFGTFILSFLNWTLAKWSSGVTWFLVELMLKAVEIMAKIPGAAVPLGKGWLGLVVIYYLVVFGVWRRNFESRCSDGRKS